MSLVYKVPLSLFQHGVFSTEEDDYFVEPLWNHTQQIDRDGHPHVVYKRSALKLPNTQAHCGVQGMYTELELDCFSLGSHEQSP